MDIFEEINVTGFVDEYIDPSLDLFAEIEKLKK
jgi:quinolinate synthase